MARPKKPVVVPEETLLEVLAPTHTAKTRTITTPYTLEAQQELTIVGLDILAPEEDKELKTGSISFVRRLEGFTDLIYMIVKIDAGTRKTNSSYRVEDLQDAYSVGCKVDSLIAVKAVSDPYQLDLSVGMLKQKDLAIKQDFSKFYNELEENGITCKYKITLVDVMWSIANPSAIITSQFEIKK